jgi:succinate dehydrogenase / fumarate reductase flavoprotein subunit
LSYCKGLKRRSADVDDAVFSSELGRRKQLLSEISKLNGRENVYKLHQILGESMTNNVTVVRNNKDLSSTLELIRELKARASSIGVNAKTQTYNQEVLFVNHFWNMLELAEVITRGALLRDESRGAHYKPDFPERNDANWLKTTLAQWTKDGPKISYADVDVKHIKPRARVYNVDKAAGKSAAA